jgi:phasin family protein
MAQQNNKQPKAAKSAPAATPKSNAASKPAPKPVPKPAAKPAVTAAPQPVAKPVQAAAPQPAAKAAQAPVPNPAPKAAPTAAEIASAPAIKAGQDAVKAGKETVQQAINAGKDSVERAVALSKEGAEKVYKASSEVATKNYEQAFAATKAQVEKSFPDVAAKMDDYAAIQKDSMDALIAAGETFGKVAEEMSQAVFDYNQKAFDASVENAKKLMECKTFQDVIELQSKIAQQQYDAFVAEQGKLSDVAMKAANDIAAPLQSRLSETVERFSKTAA